MDQRATQITDFSTELAELGRRIRTADRAKGQNVLVGFAGCLDVDPGSATYFELLSAVRSRIDRLSNFARTVQDRELHDGLREDVLTATKAFAQLFEPSQLVLTWDSTRNSYLTDASLKTLDWFGPTVRRYKPLRVVSESERAEMLHAIHLAITELENDHLKLDWRGVALVDGLRRLLFIVAYLEFFGCETAIDEISNLHHRYLTVCSSEERSSLLSSVESSSLWRVLTVLNLGLNLFILPDQIMTALPRYEGAVRSFISSTSGNGTSGQPISVLKSIILPPVPRLEAPKD